MIAFTMSNAVFDIGLRSTSDASTCPGLFHGVTDCLDKFMIAGVVLSYLDSDTQIKAMCPYVSRSATTVTFSNGTVTVVVSNVDGVTVSISGEDTPGGGGGDTPDAGLPVYTASDRGKVLTVVNKYVTSELISERTLTLTAEDEDGVVITDTGLANLSGGEIITLTVNDVEYMATWRAYGGLFGDASFTIDDDEGYALMYDVTRETATFIAYENVTSEETVPVPGEYTIHATVSAPSSTEANINWKEPVSGIYRINAVDNEGVLVLDKDYSEILLAISNGLYPWILAPGTIFTVIGYDENDLEIYCLNNGGAKITFIAQSNSDYPAYNPMG